jgi:hypothetical protein
MDVDRLSSAVGELFLANEMAPAGTYKQIGRNNQIEMSEPGYLPAGREGQVPCYVCVRVGRRNPDMRPILTLVES